MNNQSSFHTHIACIALTFFIFTVNEANDGQKENYNDLPANEEVTGTSV